VADEIQEEGVKASIKIVFGLVAKRKQRDYFGLVHYWAERGRPNAAARCAEKILDAATRYRTAMRASEAEHVSELFGKLFGILCAYTFGHFKTRARNHNNFSGVDATQSSEFVLGDLCVSGSTPCP